MPKFGFPSAERLKSRKSILYLFEVGKSLQKYPVVLRYRIQKQDKTPPIRLEAGFTVPKRVFKRAVDRNRLKRLMRESFRLEAPALREVLQKNDLRVELMFIYTGKSVLTQQEILPSIQHVLHHLVKRIKKA